MEHRTIEKISVVAHVWRAQDSSEPWWRRRRRRLLRFAELLEGRDGWLRLFSDMECLPKKDQLALRRSDSPIELAFADPVFLREGLAGDSVGDAKSFFNLSLSEAHAIFCDCRYAEARCRGAAKGEAVAEKIRVTAARRTLPELWCGATSAIARGLSAQARW